MVARLQRRWIWAAIVIVAILFSWFIFRSIQDLYRWQTGKLVKVSQFQPGTVHQVEALWIARQPDGEFYVFLDRDPHLDHPTEWVESKNQFVSPAHGETYSIDGRCLAGPCGAGSLYRVAARQEGDYLRILPDEIVSGGVVDGTSWLSGVRKLFGITERPQAR